MTLMEARQYTHDFPFPASAHHIYYSELADGMQEYECIVRFRARTADCLAAIPKVIEFTDHGRHPASTYHTDILTARTVLPQSMGLNPVKWFDGAVIANGVFAGKNSGDAVNIWVDESNGVFYFHETD